MDSKLEQQIINTYSISNPFPGLRSFEEEEHILFFGREEQVDDLISKLRRNRFLAVIGTSGSGKSSLVKSGLLPSLYGGFMAQSGSNWQTVSFRPGTDPIGNMAKSLSVANYDYLSELGLENVDYSDVIETGLRRSDRGLIDFYLQNLRSKGDNLLLLIDQFEELFRFSELEKSKSEGYSDSVAFVNLLLSAAAQKDVPVFIVFTMRSDFLGECTLFKGLPEAINDGHYLVPRMSREQIRQVITGPVAVGGATISSALVNRILNDLGDNPDQLPILQHALMRVWDYWQNNGASGSIDVSDYEFIGTLKGALSQHAEEAFEELPPSNEIDYADLCKRIFKSLTDRGKDNRGTRRPTKVSEVMLLTESTFEDVVKVTEVFRVEGRGFLMPDIGIELQESHILDISHESLMRVWTRLVAWVDEESESIQMYERLTEAAEQYEQRKGGLWRNPELSLAIKWKNDNRPNVLWAGRINAEFERTMLFLDYSIDQQRKEEEYKEFLQKSRLRRARIFAITVGSVAMVAIGLAFWAHTQKKKADVAKEEAKVERVKAEKKSEELKVVNYELVNKEERLKVAVTEAKLSAEEAKKSAQEALKAKAIAEQQRERAVLSEAEAQVERKLADSARGIAVVALEEAKSQRERAERLRILSEANGKALASVSKFAQSDFEQSNLLAKEAFIQNKQYSGSESKNSILNALYLNWNKAINHKNELVVHKSSVRMISYNESNGDLISIDDQFVLHVSKLVNNQLVPSFQTRLNKPVAGLYLVPEKKGRLLVLFADGQLAAYQFKDNKVSFEQNVISLGPVYGRTQISSYDKSLYVSGSGTLYNIANWQTSPTVLRYANVTAFDVSDSRTCVWVKDNKIQTFKSLSDLGKSPVSEVQMVGIATTASMSPNGKQYVVGTYSGKLILGSVGKNATHFAENSTDYPRVHLSSLSKVRWVESLNGESSFITTSFDHTIKLIKLSDFLENRYASELVRLDVHNAWIFGFVWVPSKQGIITYSEDKRVVFSLLSSNDLFNSLVK